jgi:putative DNA primase/helicase
MQEQNSISRFHNQDADVSATLDFLKLVLPPEGDHWYVAAVFYGGKVNHLWHRDRRSLGSCLLEADRSGATAYHACGVYRARGAGRTAKNSAGASSLWTDIDAGEGKQFDTANSAHDAMVDFCNAVGLPQPLYVCSGYGIHAYWPLGVVLDPETWKRYAAGLAALLRQHGIRNERTTDIASILRPPGTHNRKRGVVGVAVIDHQGNLPYDIQQLGLLDVGPAKKNTTTAAVNGHSIAGRLGSISATGPRYSSKALNGCAQLRDPSRDHRGYLPEPLWHLGLGVFAFIEGDGDQAAHEWSSDDDRYDENQTQRRLDRLRATTSGATTCARFHQENPEMCEACPYWQTIKSPIALCRRNEPSGGVPTSPTATHVVPSSQSGDAELDVEIRRLSGLAPALYEHERKLVADKFGIRTTVLDKLVNRVRDNGADERQGHALQLTEVEPWPEPVDGGELLHDIVREIRRYVVMPEDDAITAALWVLHSYIFDVFTCTPRLCITSPEKGCGKTTLLDVISCLINRSLAAVDVTGAAIFRTIEALQPTVLFDEADNTFNRTANGNGNASDILAILNSGHRFGGQVIRTVGDDHEPRVFRTHAPVVIALIGRAPGTLDDRSVHIRLRRKHSGERADRFRNDRTQPLQSLARRARRWSEDRRPDVAVRDPDMPEDMFNRAADNWRPLLAIADVVGGDWPTRARAAAVHSAALEKDDGQRIMLLADIRSIFQRSEVDRISSDQLVTDLCQFEEHPWLDYKRGNPINKHQVARLLEHFGIRPEPEAIRLENGERKRGYLLSAFGDAFTRYLPQQNVTT